MFSAVWFQTLLSDVSLKIFMDTRISFLFTLVRLASLSCRWSLVGNLYLRLILLVTLCVYLLFSFTHSLLLIVKFCVVVSFTDLIVSLTQLFDLVLATFVHTLIIGLNNLFLFFVFNNICLFFMTRYLRLAFICYLLHIFYLFLRILCSNFFLWLVHKLFLDLFLYLNWLLWKNIVYVNICYVLPRHRYVFSFLFSHRLGFSYRRFLGVLSQRLLLLFTLFSFLLDLVFELFDLRGQLNCFCLQLILVFDGLLGDLLELVFEMAYEGVLLLYDSLGMILLLLKTLKLSRWRPWTRCLVLKLFAPFLFSL